MKPALLTVLLAALLPGSLPPQEPEGSAQEAPADDALLAAAEGFVAELARLLAAPQPEGELDVDPLRARFSPEAAAELGEARVRGVVRSLRGEGAPSWTRLEAGPAADGAGARLIVELAQGPSVWIVTVRVDGEGRVRGWRNSPGAAWLSRAELWARSAALPGELGFHLELLDADGELVESVAWSRGRRLFPLGSIFKLYVLGELCRQVAAGELDLDDALTIRSECKSLPSGILHLREAGDEVPVREAAKLMIAISDNTATDHLMHLVGRERIEAHLAEYGLSDPLRNTPFLTTREIFSLKGAGTTVRERVFGVRTLGELVPLWLGAASGERRAWLAALETELGTLTEERLRGQLTTGYGLATLAPSHSEIEWLAAPRDVVALLRAAHTGALVDADTSRLFLELYAEGETHYRALGARSVGFKGGGETGLLSLSTRVLGDDGHSVLACLCRSRISPLDMSAAVETSRLFNAWIRNLLEGDPPPARETAAEGDPGGG